MTSTRPYMLRAIYEWIVDNNCTPYLLVDATAEHVTVPREFVEDGKIVLNIAPAAVQNLMLGNEDIQFSARFSGKPFPVYVPIKAAIAVYSRENGKGMFFQPEEGDDVDDSNTPPPPPDKPTTPNKPSRPSFLKVVK